jgi:hypothetical protein
MQSRKLLPKRRELPEAKDLHKGKNPRRSFIFDHWPSFFLLFFIPCPSLLVPCQKWIKIMPTEYFSEDLF